MKNIRKVVMTFICLVCTMACAISVQAAGTDVTKTLKKEERKQLKLLASEFENYSGYCIAYNLKVGKTKTLDCSKASARRAVLNKCLISGSTVEDLSRYLFGKKTTKATNEMGDWGLSAPELKVAKIYQLAEGEYQINCRLNWNSYYADKVDKVGIVKLYAQTKKSSHYGYVVTKVSVKKTVEIPQYADLSDYKAYNEIISRYASAVKNQWDDEKIDKKFLSPLIKNTYGKNQQEEGVGFLPKDLDGDGIYELVIANMSRDTSGAKELYAVYTLKNGKTKRLLFSTEKDRYYLLKTTDTSKGVIARELSNGAYDSACYELSLKNGDLSVVNGIIWRGESEETMECYETKDNDEDISNDELVGGEYAKAIKKNLQGRYDISECFGLDQGFFIPDSEL